jgi:hypothetical protein
MPARQSSRCVFTEFNSRICFVHLFVYCSIVRDFFSVVLVCSVALVPVLSSLLLLGDPVPGQAHKEDCLEDEDGA